MIIACSSDTKIFYQELDYGTPLPKKALFKPSK